MPEASKRSHPDYPNDKSGSEQRHQPKKQKKAPAARAKYRAKATQTAQIGTLSHTSAAGGAASTTITSSSSSSWPRHKRGFLNEAIQPGDVGIFVTSDRGKERAALREADDLISQYLERHHGQAEQREHGKAGSLAGLDHDGSRAGAGGASSSSDLSKLDLIILNIPCVSFVRFNEAAAVKFKIDLTRRQSDHLSRDATIAATAAWVQKQRLDAGESTAVDLKHWDKMVIIEAYRGLIGMSVIDVGYQQWDGPLKRGNLAEVYAAAAMASANSLNSRALSGRENKSESAR
ncbi:hypothetical protein DV737_g855, partial [Chaetothyriales sp. CBS 132003]